VLTCEATPPDTAEEQGESRPAATAMPAEEPDLDLTFLTASDTAEPLVLAFSWP